LGKIYHLFNFHVKQLESDLGNFSYSFVSRHSRTRFLGHKLEGNPGLSTFWIPVYTGMTNDESLSPLEPKE